jgi:hypothetical protein
VTILLSYGTARVLLAGDAEAREEEYMAGGPYTGPLTVINVRNYTHSEPRFRALLTEGQSEPPPSLSPGPGQGSNESPSAGTQGS